MCGNRILNDETVAVIARNNKNLLRLSLFACDLLTEQALFAIVESCVDSQELYIANSWSPSQSKSTIACRQLLTEKLPNLEESHVNFYDVSEEGDIQSDSDAEDEGDDDDESDD